MDINQKDIELNNDLKEMREQYNALKEHVDTQEIINDRLLRKTFKGHIESIHSVGWTTGLAGLFVIIASPFAFHYNPAFNMSWAFVIATDIMMLVCMGFTYFWHRKMDTSKIATQNLLEFAEEVKRLKLRYKMWMRMSFLIILPWLGWLCYEVYQKADSRELAIGFICAALIGAFIGMCIGLALDRKVLRHCNNIIDELKGF